MSKLYFYIHFVITPTFFYRLDRLQGDTEHQHSAYKNVDRLLHKSKFVHKMFANRSGSCNFVRSYIGSYKEDIKFACE